jgi:hypothetical protein
MSRRPRIRRHDPDRIAPIRDWSNLFRSSGSQDGSARSTNGVAMRVPVNRLTPDGAANGPEQIGGSAAADPVNEEARLGIESAYRVIDQHLQEGRRAAQARNDNAHAAASGAFATAAGGPAGIGLAAEGIQEMVAQGVRFFSSLAPLWTSVVNSIAASATASNPPYSSGPTARPLAPAPMPRGATAMAVPLCTIELASARMTRVTIDLAAHANAANFATSGLHAIEPNRPPLKDLAFTIDNHSNRPVVRIRVPDSQPAGVYSGVIVDKDSGNPCGTITLRIEA